MRTKVTLALIFLNAALFFFIFKFERNWRTEASTLEARRRVLGPEAADIRLLEFESAGEAAYQLVRNRDAWFLTRPLDWPANPHAVNGMVHELQLLEHETSFRVADLAQTSQSLADYGLEQPRMTVTFRSGDPTADTTERPPIHLQIGDTTRDGRRVYVLSPDGQRIHVVGRALVERFSQPLEQLRADTLLTIPVFEARSLTVQVMSPDPEPGSAAGVRVRIRRDGDRWSFETPIVARASKAAVELTINNLNALQPRKFDPPPPSAAPAVAPYLRVLLEGNNRYETLFLGETVPPARDGEPMSSTSGTEYFAQLEGRNAVFTVVVPPRLIAALRNAQEGLREKRILDFDPLAVTAITLAAPENTGAPLTLQRLEAAAGEQPRWQLVQRGSGATRPVTLPAESTAVQSLLERLDLLEAETFKSDAPTGADLEDWGFNRPEREISLSLAGVTAPLVLRLGTDAARRVVYARVGTPADPGSSIYTVDVDFRRDFSVASNDWRNRLLRESLPSGARFTQLRISDLQSGITAYAMDFGTDGEPAAPPADPTALRNVLAQLRTLRAKSILLVPFADPVVLGNETHPWRYRLEAGISLPGGTVEETATTLILVFTERLGGGRQLAGIRETDVVFEIEQPLLDALWALLHGPTNPGAAPRE